MYSTTIDFIGNMWVCFGFDTDRSVRPFPWNAPAGYHGERTAGRSSGISVSQKSIKRRSLTARGACFELPEYLQSPYNKRAEVPY